MMLQLLIFFSNLKKKSNASHIYCNTLVLLQFKGLATTIVGKLILSLPDMEAAAYRMVDILLVIVICLFLCIAIYSCDFTIYRSYLSHSGYTSVLSQLHMYNIYFNCYFIEL